MEVPAEYVYSQSKKKEKTYCNTNLIFIMPTEIANYTNFSQLRYAQCWEDADILLPALNIQSDHVCLSIASAGDNTLAMLSRSPQRVIAIDLSAAQIACLELRVAAYKELSHPELLVLIGSRSDLNNRPTEAFFPVPINPDFQTAKLRIALYSRCRSQLSPQVQNFWDRHSTAIAAGIGSAGKFERYLATFRRYIVPLIHSQNEIAAVFKSSTIEQREFFYEQCWDNWRWQLLFRLFFSQFALGRLGTDPHFFKYANRHLAEHLLQRTHYAFTTLNPAENPYLHWIVYGQHFNFLPFALRPENFDIIRANLDCLEWHCTALEDFIENLAEDSINCYNLSNIFEFMSEANAHRLLKQLIRTGRKKGRLVYWNRLVQRHRPESLASYLQPLSDLAQQLYQQDQVFFYSDFIIEEII